MIRISRLYAAKLISEYSSDRIFAVTFVKRTNGEVRTITGRKGVTKGITGRGLCFDPQSKGLVGIFDVQKDQFRFINLETIISIRLDGEQYQVID